jgi:hypothetical protein
MDPESRLDAVRSIGIRDGKIAAISATPLSGKTTLDAKGLIVSPGSSICTPTDRTTRTIVSSERLSTDRRRVAEASEQKRTAARVALPFGRSV